MRFFDSHAHLSSLELFHEIDALLDRAKRAKVEKILNICTDRFSLEQGLLLAVRREEVLNAGATPPHDVEKEGKEMFPLFEEKAKEKQLVAIGETGLEYHYRELDRKVQQQFLIRYLHLAQECSLPVIFHCRKAFSDLFAIADGEYERKAKAIVHCFTGTIEEAQEALSRGWYLSFSGIVTFKKSEELRQVVKEVPLSQLLIETDAPYLAPETKRGKQNEPAYLLETAQVIADVKGLSIEEIAEASWNNLSFLRDY